MKKKKNNNNNNQEFIHKTPFFSQPTTPDSMDGILGGCFPWSWFVDSVLWKHLCPKALFFRKRRALDTTVLPKKVVLEILSRLPLTSVVRFRLVCKQWCLLTSTQSFIEMHESNQPTPLESGFVVQYFDRKRTVTQFQLNTFFINEKATNKNKKFKMLREYIDLTQARNPKQYYHLDLLSSYKGFLLFTAKAPWPDEETALIFYNPVTKEQLTVTAPPSTYVYCGFFFHSPTKEYRILYQFDDDHYDGVVQFELLGLQTRSLRKIYVNKRFSAKYHPDLSTPAVISNGALHWMVSEAPHQQVLEGSIPSCSETILSFGMESEEFHLMPHPRFRSGRHDCVSLQRTGSHKMNLLEMDGGILCLCDGYHVLSLRIYVMENYKKWKWVLKHIVPLHAYPGVIRCYYDLHVKALQIHQGELLLYYHPYRFIEEYLLYPLNQDAEEDELDDASYKFFKWLSFGSKNLKECFDDDGLTLKKKKKKEKTRFKVAIDQLILKKKHYLDDDQYLRRMIISHPGTKPSSLENKLLDPPLTSSVGNIVVLAPSIASLKQQHQSTTNDNGGGGNCILSLQYENYSTVLTEYDVQTTKWKRVLVVDSSSSFQ